MDQQIAATGTNGATPAHELFALTDEQILDIDPKETPATESFSRAGSEVRSTVGAQHAAPLLGAMPERNPTPSVHESSVTPPATSHESPATNLPAAAGHQAEPPPWLAAQMKDPWSGQEATEFWNGVQQARSEAAAYQAYRATFANPEEARALKELYPGGVSEARSASERARLLDEIDHAYFGAAGKPPEEINASRAQLAQRLLREDPAAFREMLAAGLRALDEAEKGSRTSDSSTARTIDAALRLPAIHLDASVGAQHDVPLQGNAAAGTTSLRDAPAIVGAPTRQSTDGDAHVAAYAAFEKAANEDLERSVGGAIHRALTQALPNVTRGDVAGSSSAVGAQHAAPLQEKLASSIRAEVEKGLQGDRQLSEQVAQILAARRFDDDARAQVVRLISDRAQQLVPGAAKRVLNDWTQTTLAAHRSRSQHGDTTATRLDLAPARSDVAPASSPATSGDAPRNSRRVILSEAKNPSSRGNRLDYRKLTDEQILDMS
jgi:hypothetical protein